MRQVCIFSGSSHPALVEAICDRLGQKPAKVGLKKFSNGETSVEIKTSVRDQDVFIVQSGSNNIPDNVMELLIMISACKGGSARSITAVMPYFPYSRQSKKKSHRGAITARMLANLMNVAGVNHVITIDLHASQMQGFFKCPVDNLVAEPIVAKWIRSNVPDWQDAVVVSKNAGGTKRVTSLADALKLSFGIVTTDQRRPRHPESTHGSMQGSMIFESMGSDGTTTRRQLEDEELDQQMYSTPEYVSRREPPRSVPSGDLQIESSPLRPRGHRAQASLQPSLRNRLTNGGETPSSPLSQSAHPDDSSENGSITSLHRSQTITGFTQPSTDDDGYESPQGEDSNDERARDVITGRLIHGHIVDDDDPSPNMSTHGGTNDGRRSSDDSTGDHMMQSFMSTTSRHREERGTGLGGTADATASDEEEEEALQNPEIDMTITLVGNVKDKAVFIVDDMIDKPGSWIAAAETVVKRGGATKVYIMATHGLFGGDSLKRLNECDEIEAIIVTDAFPIEEEKRKDVHKLVTLDVSGLLSEAIRRNHHGESISQLYQHYD